MNRHMLALLADLVPVELARPDDPQSHGLGAWFWVILISAAVLALVAGAIVTHLAWRDVRRRQPAERAFVALARRLNISRTDRNWLHDLAAAASVPAVSLIMSGTAFDRALAQEHSDARSDRRLHELRLRLFGQASQERPR